MTPETARELFLPLHGLIGLSALVGGFGALLARKGSPLHRRLGQVFVLSMAGAIVAASPVLILTQNLFLTGMGAFAGYMTLTGWRIVRLKDAPATALDRGICLAMILGGCAFAVFGMVHLAQGAMLGLVPVAMGLGSALFARSHLRWFGAVPGQRRGWMAMHMGAMGGGLIAGLTAFCAAVLTNYLPSVPEFVVWLAPVCFLGPWLRLSARKYDLPTMSSQR